MSDVDGGRYEPFGRGRFPVGVRTSWIEDAGRGRRFPVETWYPATGADPAGLDSFEVPGQDEPRAQRAVRDAAAEPGDRPLVVFSHHAGGHRRSSTFLCTHLASHGYRVVAMDHSETAVPALARPGPETAEQRAARIAEVMASRVPDVRALLAHVAAGAPGPIGIAGHSLGGWTALAMPDVEPRIGAVVACAPGGSSRPRPGVLPLRLDFAWGRDVPTLYLAADQDVSIPLAGVRELVDRTPATRQLVVLRRADHAHFADDVAQEHEAVRTMPLPPELSWLAEEMRPIAELCTGAQAHLFTRGLTLAHLDATLRGTEGARKFLVGDLVGELAGRGVEASG
ncbi:MAG TPA: dienelactone hydrolase family protein [Mycobacteriales bacterium]|nr:dienelactone hydrolase family protein [Mycobacteriales bacterium]